MICIRSLISVPVTIARDRPHHRHLQSFQWPHKIPPIPLTRQISKLAASDAHPDHFIPPFRRNRNDENALSPTEPATKRALHPSIRSSCIDSIISTPDCPEWLQLSSLSVCLHRDTSLRDDKNNSKERLMLKRPENEAACVFTWVLARVSAVTGKRRLETPSLPAVPETASESTTGRQLQFARFIS